MSNQGELFYEMGKACGMSAKKAAELYSVDPTRNAEPEVGPEEDSYHVKGGNAKRATSEQIVQAYKETGSVWEAAKRLGICGQSVWERLKSLNYPMRFTRWTPKEEFELKLLAGTCPIGEIARRLGRTYGAVATRISECGLADKTAPGRPVKVPRGAGFDKTSIREHIRALDAYSGNLRQYSRANSIGIEPLVYSIQKHFPEWWESYASSHTALGKAECAYCERVFYPMTKKQKTCTRKCAAHLREDKSYFGGKRKQTIGLAEGVCQLCEEKKTVLSSHHVFGKENDPENDHLIALCQGCHRLVELLAQRKFVDRPSSIENLVILAILRKSRVPETPTELWVHVETEWLPIEEDDL